jgi:hypothetical protein
MTPTEVKEAIAKLHAERGDYKDKPMTIPGKGHWLWGIYTPIYPEGFNANYKKGTHTHNKAVGDA